MNYADAFRSLHKREPRAEDLHRFESTAALLGTTHSDTFLIILVVLDYYRHLYEQTPDQIRQACEAATRQAEVQISASTEHARAAMSAAFADKFDMTAFHARLQRYAFSVIGATLAIVAVSWIVFDLLAVRSRDQAYAAFTSAVVATVREQVPVVVQATAEAMRTRRAAEYTAVIDQRVRDSLKYADEHKAEVDALLRAEAAAPGILKYAVSPEAQALMASERDQPKFLAFTASREGQAMYRMFTLNGSRTCPTQSQQNGKAMCLFWKP
jgi:hypothetical protein